jgi:hypothetical protein
MSTIRPGEYWVALREDERPNTPFQSDGLPPVSRPSMGKINDPFDASSPSLFAAVMNSFGENTTIHLGPGIFQTFGFNDDAESIGWAPRSGQRLLGAGMNATVLKVVGATFTRVLTNAIGNEGHDSRPFISGFEVSDLTIDCNMRAHQGTGVAIGALKLHAERFRGRRVQMVDFCTEGGADKQVECFVAATGGASQFRDVYDSIFEDCLVHRACPNGFYSNSCLLIGGGEDPGGQTFARHCVLRDNFVNGEYETNPVMVSGIAWPGTGDVVTVTTKTPHGRRTGEWFIITGALMNGAEENPYNGSFVISEVVDEWTFKYELLWTPNDLAEPTGDIWIGKASGVIIPLKGYSTDPDPYNPGEPGASVAQTGAGEWTVTLITLRPHLRIPGYSVAPTVIVTGQSSEEFHGLFRITEVPNPSKLMFTLPYDPGTPDVVQVNGSINAAFQGYAADGGIGSAVRNNRAFDLTHGYYHDTHPTKDVTIKKNLFSTTPGGIVHTLGQSKPPDKVRGTEHSGEISVAGDHPPFVATFVAASPHHLERGQAIILGDGGDPENYEGSFEITSILSATKFTFACPTSLGGFHKAYTLWQVIRAIVERNVINVTFYPLRFQQDAGAPMGITFDARSQTDPYVFRRVELRGNVLQNIEQKNENSGNANLSINLDGCEQVLIERNLTGIDYYRQVSYEFSKVVKAFGNQNRSGFQISAYLFGTPANHYLNEVGTDAELISL